MSRSFAHWKTKGSAAVALAVLVVLGVLAVPAFGAGYQLNGLGAGCTEPGNSNTVHGNKFDANSPVSIMLGSTQIGVTNADGAGNVSASFVVPTGSPTGTTSVKLVGDSADGPRTLSFELKVGGCSEEQNVSAVSGTGAENGSGSGSGVLAFTGGNVGMTVGIGAAVLVLGVALVASARRKRSAHDAA